MKRVLLINPYINDFTAYDLWVKPLGLYKLAFALKKLGFKVFLYDLLNMSHPSIPKRYQKRKENGTGKFYFEYIKKPENLPNLERRFKRYGISKNVFKGDLKKIKKIDCIFLTSTMTYWYLGIQDTIEVLKDTYGNVPIILGGIYPTILYEHSKTIGVDFSVRGSFEENLPPILKEIFGTSLSFDFEILPQYSLAWEKSSLPIQTSKGCPLNCFYCASKLIDPSFFQYSLDYIFKVLKDLKKLKTKNIAFYDDALLSNKEKHIKIILKKIKEENLSFSFHTPNGLNIKEIDEELCFLFKETNFKTIRLSVDFLNFKYKKIGVEELKRVTLNFFKAGFKKGEIEAYLLIGFPEQKFEEVKEALKILKELNLVSRFAYFSPILGTKEWENLKEKGYVKDGEDPILSNKLLFPYRFKGINPEELKELKKIQNDFNQKI